MDRGRELAGRGYLHVDLWRGRFGVVGVVARGPLWLAHVSVAVDYLLLIFVVPVVN